MCYTDVTEAMSRDQNQTVSLAVIEPMVAYLNGSYNQWRLEQSLIRELTLADVEDPVAAFQTFSFNSTVLPVTTIHCRLVIHCRYSLLTADIY